MAKTLIDVKELSKRLGSIAVGTIYNWSGRGGLLAPFKRKIGRCLRFDWEEIEEKLLARSTMGKASKGEGA